MISGNIAEGSGVLGGPILIVDIAVVDADAVADGTAVSVWIVVSVGELVRVKFGVGKSSGVVVFILGVWAEHPDTNSTKSMKSENCVFIGSRSLLKNPSLLRGT